MDLKQLQYFLAVAEQLNFTQAAERLYISQPALSQRIAELEQELGVRLLQRTKRRVTLTAAGESMVGICRDILNRVDAIPNMLQKAQAMDGKSGVLRIGASENSCKELWFRVALAKTMKEMKLLFPFSSVEVLEIPHPSISPDALDQDFDLFLAVHHSAKKLFPDLNQDIVYTDRLALMVSSSYRPEVAVRTCRTMLDGATLFQVDNTAGINYQLSLLLAELKVSPRIRYLGSEAMSMLQVYSGNGALIFPKRAILSQEKAPALEVLDIESDSANLYYMTLCRPSHHNALIPVFRELLRRFCNEDV